MRKSPLKLLFAAAFFLLFGNTTAQALDFVSVQSGSWGDPATWNVCPAPSGQCLTPGENDDVTISAGHTVTEAAGLFRSLTINGTLQTGQTSGLGVTGNVVVAAAGIFSGFMSTSGASFINNGSVIISLGISWGGSGSHTLSGSGTWTTSETSGFGITGSGTFSLANDMIFDCSFVNAGTGTLDLNGNILTVTVGGFGGSGVTNGIVRLQPQATLSLSPGGAGSPLTASLEILSGIVTTGSDGAIDGPIRIASGATFSIIGLLFTAGLNANGNITINSGGALTGDGSLSSYERINFNGASFVNNGTVSVLNFSFSGNSSQTLSGSGTFSPTTVTVNSGASVTTSSDLQVGLLSILNGGTLDISNRTVSLSGSGGLPLSNSGTFVTTGSTIVFNGTSQQSLQGANTVFHNLTINNPAGVGFGFGITVNNLLRVLNGGLVSDGVYKDVQIDSAGTLISNLNTINLSGNWTNNGTFTSCCGTVNCIGTSAQNIGGSSATTFNNLTINNSNGITLNQNITFNGTFTLTSGNVTTGVNILTVPASGTVNRTSGHVIGNLKKVFGGVSNFTYHVGTANGYSPVNVTVTSGSGDLTAEAVQSAQPNLSMPTKALQRYWTLAGSGVIADLTFNYVQTDVPATANETAFVVLKYNGNFSQPPNQSVDSAANTATVTGASSFSDWTLGEPNSIIEFVTNTNDSGAGSLRQAIIDANSNPGTNTIAFEFSGSTTINLLSPLPTINDSIIIDGTTAPGYSGSPIIELNGAGAGANANGLTIAGGNSTVKGLVINRFSGSGIVLQTNGGNTIQGCYIGTNAAGTAALANSGEGVRLDGASSNTIGGSATGAGNVISGNVLSGVFIVNGANNNVVRGNLIGTDKNGAAAIGNQQEGVLIQNASNNTVGGTAAGERNVISANFRGVSWFNNAINNFIRGNFIGTDVTGTSALGNTQDGILADGGDGNSIQLNAVAFNGWNGINVLVGVQIRMFGNNIFSNTRLGIDLGGNGVTPNDLGDDDTGPNNYQNFPVIDSALTNSTSIAIQGTLKSTSNSIFLIDFFANPSCDSAGSGEGQTYLGTSGVTTDGSGNAPINAAFNFAVAAGQVVTATASTVSGDTSEFSACRTVTQSAALSIDGVIPPAGRASGGQQIKLTGSFANLSTVTMGGVSASFSFTNGTSEVTVTTPPHAVGAVSIDLAPTSGSPFSKSNAFAFLPTVFTDNTLMAQITTAKAQHIIELRHAVDALRAVAGLGPAPWTDPSLLPFSISIKAVHILELRAFLEDAASRLGYAPGSYTDAGLTTGFVIKRLHIEELRQRIRAIAG